MDLIDRRSPSTGSASSSACPGNEEGLPSLRRMANSFSIRARTPIQRRLRKNSTSSNHDIAPLSMPADQLDMVSPSILKKHFCPLERIRTGQHGEVDKQKKQQRTDRSLDADHAPRFLQAHDISPRPRTAEGHRRHRNKSAMRVDPRGTTVDRIVTADDALWYRSLPDKIRRQQFSQTEQHILNERCEALLVAFNKSTESEEIAVGTFCESEAEQRRPSSVGQVSDLARSRVPTRPSDPLHGRIKSSARSHSLGMLTTHPSATFDESLDRSGSATPPPIALTRKIPASRSLVPLPLPPPRLAPLSTMLDRAHSPVRSISPPTTNFSWRRNPTSDVSNRPEAPSPSRTTHYKDPETRKTLRNYLSSTQRFDEVIEFGFPVRSSGGSISSNEDHFQVHRSSVYSDDGTCLSFESQGPLTPITISSHHQPYSPRILSSVDSGIALPLSSDQPCRNDSCNSLGVGQREMTIHMTLTRPDIQTAVPTVSESKQADQSGPNVMSNDPLALEALTFCDDDTGAHGAFAVRRSASHGDKVKMAFRSLRARG
nr:hypothetical protein CFP56_10151 [Quercus suber]